MMRPVIDLSGVNFARVEQVMEEAKLIEDWSPPQVLPPAWEIILLLEDGGQYRAPALGLTAIITGMIQQDGRAWLHLSVSHVARIPRWGEIREAKEIFLGDREAYSVLPPKARYVNIHPHVLHLFALRDPQAVALPDFTHGTGSL